MGASNNEAAPRKVREGSGAILVSTDGLLLLQLRDNLPNITDPGKISLFGGRREGGESFLECVVRELYEETGYYVSADRFELVARYSGPHHSIPDTNAHGEFFVARGIPIENLAITEGTLMVVALDNLDEIRDRLSDPARYALDIFLQPPIV